MTVPALACHALRKTYPGRPPVEAVRGIDLAVPAGECFGLLGPNGAGKTTTMEICEGILDATAGSVELFGLRWGRDDAAIKQRIGIALQETRLAERLTVRETVTLFRSFYRRGLDPDDCLKRVALNEKAASRLSALSGGQKQRVALACALVGDPEMLFLDEPTTGLDPQSRRQLWDVIGDFKAQGRTVFLTTHYMDEAERLCDRVGVVDHGTLIALDSPRALIDRLGGAHVIEFTLDGDASAPADAFAALPAVQAARAEAGGVVLHVAEPHVALPALLDFVRGRGWALAGLSTRHASLEDVFVSLTGRHLRDAEAA